MSTASTITALENALATGVKSIEDEHGREIEYHSPQDMIAAIASLKATLQEANNALGFAVQPLVTSGTRN